MKELTFYLRNYEFLFMVFYSYFRYNFFMNYLQNIDIEILRWIQFSLRNPALTSVFTFITSLGNSGFIWIASSLVLIVQKKWRKVGIISLLALLISLLITFAIKLTVMRPRPFMAFEDLVNLIMPSEMNSFPSGHTSSSIACAAVIYKYLPKKWGITAYILAFLIAFSRLYVGVHYPSDVIAGALVGWLSAYLAVKLFNWLKPKYLKEI